MNPFDSVLCESCSGISKHVHMECAGFTSSGSTWVCNQCGDVMTLDCGHCETCKFWAFCEWRIVPAGKPKITACASTSKWFGRFLHYNITWGVYQKRVGTLKQAVSVVNELMEGIRYE